MAGARGRAGHRPDGQGRRRLHRRDDRPFRARRAFPPVRPLQQDLMNVFSRFQTVTLDALRSLVEAGSLPGDLDLARVAAEPPRDPAQIRRASLWESVVQDVLISVVAVSFKKK